MYTGNGVLYVWGTGIAYPHIVHLRTKLGSIQRGWSGRISKLTHSVFFCFFLAIKIAFLSVRLLRACTLSISRLFAESVVLFTADIGQRCLVVRNSVITRRGCRPWIKNANNLFGPRIFVGYADIGLLTISEIWYGGCRRLRCSR